MHVADAAAFTTLLTACCSAIKAFDIAIITSRIPFGGVSGQE